MSARDEPVFAPPPGWVVAFAREGAQLSFFAGRLAFAGGGLVPRFLRVALRLLGFVEAQTALIRRQTR
jgi:hypothetical protein